VTTQTLWIVVVVAVVVVLIALVAGITISRRRKISLREPEQLETPEEPKPRQGNTYTAGGGFDFSAGGGTATAEPPAETAPDPAPDPAPEPEPAAPAAEQAEPAIAERPPGDELTGTADDVRTPPRGLPTGGTATEARTPPEGVPAVREPDTDTPPDGVPVTPAAVTPTAEPPTTETPTAKPPTAEAPTTETPAAPVAEAPTTEVPTAPEPGTPAPAPAAPTEEIAPAEGRLERLRGNLSRSRSAFGQSLLGLLGGGELDEESWEDVEATLLQADLGPETTAEIVGTLRTELARRAVRTPAEAKALLREVLIGALGTDMDRSIRALPHDGRPGVLLVVGVNGTGKTTTTGKLARVLVAGGRTVVLGAADTFRAAAAEQLATWGERSGAAVVRGAEGADPAAVAFDAVKRGTADGADVVLLDTAGRLHTKTGLMDELGKVKRVVEKQSEVDEVILVLDATTGQNGMIQARVFGEVVKVTGIALTKLDGTAKGGIVFRVQRELGVPVKLVGLGEGPDDLAPFEPAAFVDALLG
jgi:fused signal recognition particle receptor